MARLQHLQLPAPPRTAVAVPVGLCISKQPHLFFLVRALPFRPTEEINLARTHDTHELVRGQIRFAIRGVK